MDIEPLSAQRQKTLRVIGLNNAHRPLARSTRQPSTFEGAHQVGACYGRALVTQYVTPR